MNNSWQLQIAWLLLAAPLQGQCQIYVSPEVAGAPVVLSNFQSDATPLLLVGSGPGRARPSGIAAAPSRANHCASREQFRELIDGVARSVEIAPELVHAVISAESNYDPAAVSRRGAIGLMQLMPATAVRFGIANPFIARDNVFAGASYLKWLVQYFGEDLELVLAAYNAGEQAVLKAGRRIPPYPETQAYVRRIMADLGAGASAARDKPCEAASGRT